MERGYYFDLDTWKNHVDEIQDALRAIASDAECRKNLGDTFCGDVREWNRKITEARRMPFTIVFTGEFKRGKSSLINALLGENVVPVSIIPETMTINTICYGEHRNEAVMENGKRLPLSDDELCRDKLLDINAAHEGKITHLRIYRPFEILRRVNIIDTPGMNDITGDIAELTKGVVRTADAVVFVCTVDSPISLTEYLYLKTTILPHSGVDLFLVVNKSDFIEIEDMPSFKQSMDDRADRIIKGLTPYYVSALNENRERLGKPLRNPSTADMLKNNMKALRTDLTQLVEARYEMATPSRVNSVIEDMRHDLNQTIDVIEQGAIASEREVAEAEQTAYRICTDLEAKLSRMTDMVKSTLGEAMETTSNLMSRVLKVLRDDLPNLSGIDKDDIVRNYPFFLIDRLQESIDLCYSQDISTLTSLLMAECGEDVVHILEHPADNRIQVSFHIDNQTWTRGDDMGFIGRQFNMGLFSFVIDGIAGAMRNRELQDSGEGGTSDIISQIFQKFDALEDETHQSVRKIYSELESNICEKLRMFFADKIQEAQERFKMAQDIYELGSNKKEEINVTVKYIRSVIEPLNI